MDHKLQAAYQYIDRHREAMTELWKNIVSIESPSADTEAVGRIASHLDTYCDTMGMQRQIYTYDHAGPTFTAQTPPGHLKPIALLGHMDTVHPVGSFGPEPFRTEGDTVFGPGVLDCKGGSLRPLMRSALYSISDTTTAKSN